MYIIAGLGNPEEKYKRTRHNTGFRALDALAEKCGIAVTQDKFRALCGQGMIGSEKVLLMKPQTYMNLSGTSIAEAVHFYKLPSDHILVMYDDIDLPAGQLRIREEGSAGSHNGMRNIVVNLGTEKFPRIRIGIGGKPEGYDLADYVLGHYSEEQKPLMEQAFQNAADAAVLIVSGDIRKAMNRYNTINKKKKKPAEKENHLSGEDGV